jgi:hypothetical protein
MKTHENNETLWPIKSMLFIGYYGSNSPGAGKFISTIFLSLILFLIGFITLQIPNELILNISGTAIILLSVVLSIWAQYQYLKKLDDLTKNIQLTGFAFSYGVVVVICMILMSIEFITGYMPSILWILIAEPIRGIALYKIARRYQ